ncbi:MAG: restriction endonuclease subunit S, partial [Cyanobacteriota bacterium]
EQFITQDGLNNSATKLFPPGTLMMAMYGQGKTRGKVAILGIKASINQACAAISLNENIDHDYAFHYLISQYEAIRNLSNIGNQENLNGLIIRSIKIPIPPFPEQRVIASVLSDMDAEIAALETRRAKTQAIKQGMMQELLTGKTRLV